MIIVNFQEREMFQKAVYYTHPPRTLVSPSPPRAGKTAHFLSVFEPAACFNILSQTAHEPTVWPYRNARVYRAAEEAWRVCANRTAPVASRSVKVNASPSTAITPKLGKPPSV